MPLRVALKAALILPVLVFAIGSRTRDWLKFKNPAAPAVKREAEEEWGKEHWR